MTVRLWSLASGEEVQRLEGHTDWVRSVAVTSDGQRIVSGSWDRTIRVWSTPCGLARQELSTARSAMLAVREIMQPQQQEEEEPDSRCLPEMVLRCFIVEEAAVVMHRSFADPEMYL
eukprot:EC795383.1.p2 GENE.EC795383.1~~EC795383.1.p2  ORF type:complete len:117 (+),score=21.39 EC795383.1:192-542(+)